MQHVFTRHHSKSGVSNQSWDCLFLFFCHPTPAPASWRHPLWCSVWAWERGWGRKSRARGRWGNESSPKLKEVASVSFFLIDLNSGIHLFLPDGILLLDWASKRERNVSCWKITPSNPGLKRKKQALQSRYILQWLWVSGKRRWEMWPVTYTWC